MGKTLFINGVIRTMDDKNSVYDSMFVRDGRIVDMGDYDSLKEKYYDAEIVDLQGRLVLPGFTESHIHVIEAARSIVDLNLKGIETFEEFKNVLISFSISKDTEWVIGSGWDEGIFGGRMPNRHDIDRVINDKPVCLVRQDGHSMVLNSKALKLLRLNEDENIRISKNAIKDDEGLTGLFYEEWVFEILGLIMERIDESYFENAIIVLQRELLKSGITMVNDIMTQYPRFFKIYNRLQEEGKLKIRMACGGLGKSKELEKFLELEDGMKIKKGPCKYFLDGSFGSKTALLIEGYEDEPDNKGVQTLRDDELEDIIEFSLKNTFPIALHAIGDLAIKKFLDIYERLYKIYPNKNVRNRVEHIQIIRDEDIERFKNLNLIASFQPIFTLEKELTLKRVGERRIKDTYRFRTFLEKGIKVIFNSDTPFGAATLKNKEGKDFNGFEPLLGIHCAVNDINLNKGENVTVKQAVECYTKNAAYANYMENIYGTLERGKYADFVVLEEDIFNINPEQIKDVEIFMTVIDGEVGYIKE